MVRRNELACRDEWSQSLWAPRQEGAGKEPAFERPPGIGPEPAANVDEMRAIITANNTRVSNPGDGEDVLLSEGRIISEAHEPPVPREPARSYPVGSFDSRTAVIRAREAYRERARARETAERQSAGAEALASPRDPGDQSADGVILSPSEEPASAAPAPIETARDVSSVDAVKYGGISESGRADATDQTVGDSDRFDRATDQGRDLGAAPGPEAAEQGRDWTFEAYPGEPDSTSAPDHSKAYERREPELALEHLDALDEHRLPEWFRNDLPRMCRACRDFRPSDGSERGSCANAWAFTHRRLVHEDDMAPCDSAIGDWWAPVDDVWLVAADVSSHGTATPLLDQMTGGRSERRRRS